MEVAVGWLYRRYEANFILVPSLSVFVLFFFPLEFNRLLATQLWYMNRFALPDVSLYPGAWVHAGMRAPPRYLLEKHRLPGWPGAG